MIIYIIWLIGVIAWNYGFPVSNSFGRCASGYSSIFFKYGVKKIFKNIIILKKSRCFDNKQLQVSLNYQYQS